MDVWLLCELCICFAPNGQIWIGTINAPGSWHDSTLADYGVYDKMEDLYREHLCKVVIDFAFNLQGRKFLIESSQTNPTDPYALALNNDATKLWQLSEHGMRQIQAQFPWLKDRLLFEEFDERKVILNLMILMYNFNTAKIGINEILNSFMSKTKGFYDYTEHNISDSAYNMFYLWLSSKQFQK